MLQSANKETFLHAGAFAMATNSRVTVNVEKMNHFVSHVMTHIQTLRIQEEVGINAIKIVYKKMRLRAGLIIDIESLASTVASDCNLQQEYNLAMIRQNLYQYLDEQENIRLNQLKQKYQAYFQQLCDNYPICFEYLQNHINTYSRLHHSRINNNNNINKQTICCQNNANINYINHVTTTNTDGYHSHDQTSHIQMIGLQREDTGAKLLLPSTHALVSGDHDRKGNQDRFATNINPNLIPPVSVPWQRCSGMISNGMAGTYTVQTGSGQVYKRQNIHDMIQSTQKNCNQNIDDGQNRSLEQGQINLILIVQQPVNPLHIQTEQVGQKLSQGIVTDYVTNGKKRIHHNQVNQINGSDNLDALIDVNSSNTSVVCTNVNKSNSTISDFSNIHDFNRFDPLSLSSYEKNISQRDINSSNVCGGTNCIDVTQSWLTDQRSNNGPYIINVGGNRSVDSNVHVDTICQNRNYAKLSGTTEIDKKRSVESESDGNCRDGSGDNSTGNGANIGTSSIHMKNIQNMFDITPDLQYQCTECKKIVRTRSGVTSHINSHLGIRNYPCRYCHLRFGGKTTRDRHELRHTGERPFECQICNKRFRVKSVLVNHQTTHTKEKNYHCNICNKDYAYLSSLKRHEKLKHTPQQLE